MGKIICRAAAEHLTPCIMELGGKNPVFVTSQADWKSAIWKILDNKFLNAGQFCVSPDYVLLDESIDIEEFKAEVKAATLKYFDSAAKGSEHYARIVAPRHHERLMKMLEEEHGGEYIIGGPAEVTH